MFENLKGFATKSIEDIRENFGLTLKVLNKSTNELPKYESDYASGFDLRASLTEPMILGPGEFKMVPTGLFFEIPDLFEIQVRPRSGLAAKHGVTVLNTPGTIDSDYTGECKVILINHSKVNFIIENGDRIAQGIFSTVLKRNVVKITEITEITKNSDRGTGGFGSTGTK